MKTSTGALIWALVLAVPAAAQMQEADPEATKAFEALVRAYRQRPALLVETTVTIELAQDGVKSAKQEVQAQFVLGPDRRGVVKLRDFTCWLDGGRLTAIHEGNDDGYYSVSDDGSPYYALLNEFQSMPFPLLAIAFGEADIGDLCMQFHPMAPWIQPTAAGTAEADGRTLGEIRMTSDFADLVLRYDPKTRLIESIVLAVTGGDLVQPGAVLTCTHSYKYEVLDGLGDRMNFDPGNRQRVDLISALLPPPPAGGLAAAPGGGPAFDPGQAPGGEAPEFTLATADGGTVDLRDLRGRVVVLDFWATWCGPCRYAMPMLHEVARWAAAQDTPISIITVNALEGGDADKRLDAVRAFWKQQGYTLPVAMDYSDATARAYGVKGLPMSVVIRADGIVHAMHMGVMPDYVESLKREIGAAAEARP